MKRLRIFGASVLLLVLFGVAASLYSHISRIAYYDFPFAKVDIDRIEFRSILDDEEVILNDSEEIERLYNLLTKMRISEDLLEPSQNTLLLGNQGFAIKIHTVSGNEYIYQYDQHDRTASGGSGIFDDGNSKYSVEKLDLTRIWLDFQKLNSDSMS